jgi:histidyl-tRNA synthetase
MGRPRFQAPKGTRDLLPPDTALWAAVEATAREVFSRYGYQEIRTPIFEDTELFVRGVGEGSDIVGKEMYTFEDKGGRSVTLRPESTAAVCRAYVEHGMQHPPRPVRLFYIGPQFRYERPQKGRYRQFHQIGAELLGAKGSRGEIEVLAMLDTLFAELGFEDRIVLLNTVGDRESRERFRERLVEYLRPLAGDLSEDSRRRIETNPLRILDSKSREEQELLARGPKFADSLTPASRGAFLDVKAALDELGIGYREAPHLVRGLDYYTETVFEIVSMDERLGAQNALCGGGSYDGLIEELGGQATNGVGFAIGEDRLIDVLPQGFQDRVHRRRQSPVLVVSTVEETGSVENLLSAKAQQQAFIFAERLRRAGLAATFLGVRSLQRILDHARKNEAPFVVAIGPSEAQTGRVRSIPFSQMVEEQDGRTKDRWMQGEERVLEPEAALGEIAVALSARTPKP